MILYLVIFYAWLLILFTVGGLVSKLLAHAPNAGLYQTLLRNLFSGYVTFVGFYSVFKTEFKTINIVLILIGILVCFEVRRKKPIFENPKASFQPKQLLILFVVASILVLLPWLTIGNNESYLKFFYNNSDYVLYGRIAETLNLYGQENGFAILNQLDKYYNGPEPYHFFDIWGGAIVSNLFSINVFPALMVIIYPTFYLLVFLGYMSLLKVNNIWSPLIAFLLLLVGGISLSFIDHRFFRSLDNLAYALVSPNIYKLSYFYAFLVSALLLYRSGLIVAATLVCLALPVANIITLPSIVPALFVLLAVLYLRTPGNRREISLSLGCIFVVSIAILLFYFLNPRQSAGLAGAEISKPIDLVGGIIYPLDITTRRNIIIGGVISLIMLYLGHMIILLLNRRNINKTLLAIFPLSVIAISLLVWAVLFRELNSSQVFSNISIVVINISIAIVLIDVINAYANQRPSKAIIITSVILFGATIIFQATRDIQKAENFRVTLHTDDYLRKVEETIAPNSLVGSIKTAAEMTSAFMKYNAVYTLGDYLLLQDKQCFAVSMSDLSTPVDSTSEMTISRSMKAVRDGMFYRYSKLARNSGLNEDELAQRFVKEFQMRYIIASKDAVLPSSLSVHANVVATDPLSGERLLEILP
jgi:hypothetical protein